MKKSLFATLILCAVTAHADLYPTSATLEEGSDCRSLWWKSVHLGPCHEALIGPWSQRSHRIVYELEPDSVIRLRFEQPATEFEIRIAMGPEPINRQSDVDVSVDAAEWQRVQGWEFTGESGHIQRRPGRRPEQFQVKSSRVRFDQPVAELFLRGVKQKINNVEYRSAVVEVRIVEESE